MNFLTTCWKYLRSPILLFKKTEKRKPFNGEGHFRNEWSNPKPSRKWVFFLNMRWKARKKEVNFLTVWKFDLSRLCRMRTLTPNLELLFSSYILSEAGQLLVTSPLPHHKRGSWTNNAVSHSWRPQKIFSRKRRINWRVEPVKNVFSL